MEGNKSIIAIYKEGKRRLRVSVNAWIRYQEYDVHELYQFFSMCCLSNRKLPLKKY